MSKVGDKFRGASGQLQSGVKKAKNAVKSATSRATQASDAAGDRPAKERLAFRETVMGDRYNKAFDAGMRTLGRNTDTNPRQGIAQAKAQSLANASDQRRNTSLRSSLGLSKQEFATLTHPTTDSYTGKDPQTSAKMLDRTQRSFGAAAGKLPSTQDVLDALAKGTSKEQVEVDALAVLGELQTQAAGSNKAPTSAQVAAYTALLRGLLTQAVVQTSAERTLTGQPKNQIGFVQDAAGQLNSLKDLKRNPLGRSLNKKATRLQADVGQLGPQLGKGATHAKHAARMAGDYAHEGAARAGAGLYVAGKAVTEAGKAPFVAAKGFFGAVRKAGGAFTAEVRDFAKKHDQFARAPGAPAAEGAASTPSGEGASSLRSRSSSDAASVRSRTSTNAASTKAPSDADAASIRSSRSRTSIASGTSRASDASSVTVRPQTRPASWRNPFDDAESTTSTIKAATPKPASFTPLASRSGDNPALEARMQRLAKDQTAFERNYDAALRAVSPGFSADFSRAKIFAEFATRRTPSDVAFVRQGVLARLRSALTQDNADGAVQARARAYVEALVNEPQA